MEVERVTVKVELETKCGRTSIEATAALDFREGRTKEDAAAAAYNLSRALQDSLDAGGHQGPPSTPSDPWDALEGSESWRSRQQAPAQTTAQSTDRKFCPIDREPMQQYSNAKGSWWSHKRADGSWCHGK